MEEKDLIDFGYTRYRHNPDGSPYYFLSYQRCIEDTGGRKYIIDCDIHDFNQVHPNSKTSLWFSFRAQLVKNGKPFLIKTVDWFANPNISTPTLSEVEIFFENIWTNTKCDYLCDQ